MSPATAGPEERAAAGPLNAPRPSCHDFAGAKVSGLRSARSDGAAVVCVQRETVLKRKETITNYKVSSGILRGVALL